MALSTVLFDLDGTLLDTNGLHTDAWFQALRDHDYHVGRDRIARLIGLGGDRFVAEALGEDAEAAKGDALREAHGSHYLELISRHRVKILPGVYDLFSALRARGLQIGIATASKEEHLEAVLEEAGLPLHDLADVVVSDSDVEQSKPAPDVVSAAVRKLGVAPGACVFVGDTPYDARAALRAGTVLLGVLTGVHPPDRMHRAGARATFSDLTDLLAHLDEALRSASPYGYVLSEEKAQLWMEEALDEARGGGQAGEVPIGALVLDGAGAIVGRGHNRARGRRSQVAHAELEALLDAAGRTGAARDLCLVTTLEPCVMCLGAALAAGVDTVVYALEAPPNGARERVEPYADRPMPRMIGAVSREQSRTLLAEWAAAHPEAHFVHQVLASLDD